MGKFYGVRVGRSGVYNKWLACQVQVYGFSGAEYKGFEKLEDAEDYVSGSQQPRTTASYTPTSRSAATLQFAPSASPRSQHQSSASYTSHPYRRQLGYALEQTVSSTTSSPTGVTSSSSSVSTGRYGVLYCDGAAKGNPGPIGCGGLLYETHRGDSKQLLETFKRYLGPHGTNNESEYQGMIIGMELALKYKITHLTIKVDSKLVAKQLRGDWKVKAQNLQVLHQKALGLAAQFESCQVQHIFREENSLADQLANEAISDERED